MKMAVTGASGHLGGNLVRLLLSGGHTVSCLARHDTRAVDGLDVRVVHGDVLDRDALAELVKDADFVFHLAALITLRYDDPTGRVEKVNVQGTRNIIDACRKSGVSRLVHFGSINVFDKNQVQGVFDETAPMSLNKDLPVYDRTKAKSALAVMDAVKTGLDAVVVCPTGVIGPFDFKPSPMGRMLKKVATAKLPVAINGGFNWVDVRDVAQGALDAAQKGQKGEIYILGGQWAHLKEVFGITASEAKVHAPLWYPPIGLVMPGALFMDALCKISRSVEPAFTRMSLQMLKTGRSISIEKAGRELGFRPRPLKDTLADTVEWFKNHSPEDS